MVARLMLLCCALMAASVVCVSCSTYGQGASGAHTESANREQGVRTSAGELHAPKRQQGRLGATASESRRQEPVEIPEKLTLEDALFLALRANKNIRAARLGADAAEARTEGPKGEFDPEVFLELTRGRSNRPEAAVPIERERLAEGGLVAGVRKRAQTGTTLELAASTQYSRDLSEPDGLNPSYEPELRVSLRQDLLKDFGIDVNRTDILIARNNWKISAEQLKDSVLANLFEVERVYWELYFAMADLKLRRTQLERAGKLVETAEALVRVGRSSELEIVRAMSSEASQRVTILAAENEVEKLRHGLLRLLGVLDVYAVDRDFRPADEPPTKAVAVPFDEAMQAAQKARPDYVQAHLQVENNRLAMRFAKNQRLPELSLFGEYSLSGMGDDPDSSLDELDSGDFASWRAGVSFEVPLPDRAGRSDYRAARFEYERAKVELDSVLERITREVADALADVRTQKERIAAARTARELAERALRDEEKSYKLGRSDSLDVINAQDALAAAERDEVRALADYAVALANLSRVEGTTLEEKGIAWAE